MKIWGIIATVLLVMLLVVNVWFCTSLSNLSADIGGKIREVPSGPEYFPPQAVDNIKAGFNHLERLIQTLWMDIEKLEGEKDQLQEEVWQLQKENQRLKSDIENCKAAIVQIQQEAQKASQRQQWESLLGLIFSFLF